MNILSQIRQLLDGVEQLGSDRLVAACPVPGHLGPGRLLFGLRKSGEPTFACEGGCEHTAIVAAIEDRARRAGKISEPQTSLDIDRSIPGGTGAHAGRHGEEVPAAQKARAAIQAIRGSTGYRRSARSYETTDRLAGLIVEVLEQSGARCVNAAGTPVVLANGKMALLDPGDDALDSMLTTYLGLAASDADIKYSIKRVGNRIRSSVQAVPVRAGNHLDRASSTLYVPFADGVLTIDRQGQIGAVGQGEHVLFVGRAVSNASDKPAELPSFDRLAALLDCAPFVEEPSVTAADGWTTSLAWLLATFLQDAVSPVPLLVLTGNAMSAYRLGEAFATVIAGPDYEPVPVYGDTGLNRILGIEPIVILDNRDRTRLPAKVSEALRAARFGYLRRAREPLEPSVPPIALTFPLLIAPKERLHVEALPRDAVVLRLGGRAHEHLQEAAEDRHRLFCELATLAGQVLPAMAQEGIRLPVRFEEFVGVVHTVLGGAPERTPNLRRLRPEARRAEELLAKDDVLSVLEMWLVNGRGNFGRLLPVRELYCELLPVSELIGIKFPCANVLSLAARLRRLQPILVRRWGYVQRMGRSRTRMVGFTKGR